MGPTTNVVPKACRNCRIRKIRCNREVPCSNCVTSKIACQGNAKDAARVVTNETQARQETDIEKLQGRVAALEKLLNNALGREEKLTTTTEPTSFTPRQSPCSLDITSLEGDSSFRKQAQLATDIPELDSFVAVQSPQVVDQVSDLRKLLDGKDGVLQPRNWSRDPVGGALQGQMPPSDFVIRLLRAITGSDPILTLFYPMTDLKQFEDLCRQVYFPIQPATVGEISLLSGMIMVVLTEHKTFPFEGFLDEEVDKYLRLCTDNFYAGLETYEVNMVPTLEHCLVLYMAALNAQTKGELALQWRLTAAATKHCLTLGYHREHVVKSFPPLERNRIRRLFWQVYFSDKSLVLSLGRASMIQDFDVDVEPHEISSDPGRYPWDTSLIMFVNFAKIQAQIYEALYSPASRRRTKGERQLIVETLSKRLVDWHESWKRLDSSKACRKSVFDNTFGPVDVSYYSTLTLLHRAVDLSKSVNVITDACFDAAKRGLRAHTEIHARYKSLECESYALYAVWVHVYSSFTPYLITFLHCIANSDVNDLGLLKSSLDILEDSSRIVESCKRPYEFCKYLYGIAEAYVSACSMAIEVDVCEAEAAVELSLQQPLDGNWFLPESDFFNISSF